MEELVPTEYYLSRNHPDPFKEKTIIKFCVPEEVKVNLEIFDYEKRKVKTLVNEIKEPGTYQVEFESNGIKEGIYLYRMIAGRFVMTRKMLYLK